MFENTYKNRFQTESYLCTFSFQLHFSTCKKFSLKFFFDVQVNRKKLFKMDNIDLFVFILNLSLTANVLLSLVSIEFIVSSAN